MICGSADTISDLFSSSCYKDALDDLPVLKPEHKKWVEHQGLPPLVNAREPRCLQYSVQLTVSKKKIDG